MLCGVFDEHLNRQHRLSYFVRGPEWAFAIPQGDLAALEEVMQTCSTVWNGVGSLILPVRANGRMPPVTDLLLDARPVDACWMHGSLGDRARAAVQKRIPGAVPLWDGFDRDEVHPLQLRGSSLDGQEPPLVVEVPRLRSAPLRRAALALWGHIPDEDLPHWEQRYVVNECTGDAATRAMLHGQIGGRTTSPLRTTELYMGVVRQIVTGLNWPYLWVLPSAGFDALVTFWNFRARSLARANGTAVLGVLREWLSEPDRLQAINDWVPRTPGLRRTPDVLVACSEDEDEAVRTAMATLPMREVSEHIGREEVARTGMEPHDPPTFAFYRPHLAGPFTRGAAASTLIAVTGGTTSLALPPPDGFAVRTVRHTRLVLVDLPMPLPVTSSAARRIDPNAQARDGVMLTTWSRGEWNFNVRLPTAAIALQDWVVDHGFALTRSQDGLDADALLRRLGTLDALDVLADRQRLAILRTLAPTSRVKLARRFIAEAKAAGVELNEATMVERLADVGLFLEMQARTAGEIASAIGGKKKSVLAHLVPLVDAGFVRRGHSVRCPRCRFRMLLALSELDERVRCRACGESFLLPVTSGAAEPEVSYQLDGLMARAMDQDVLPALLTLRAVKPPPNHAGLFFAWPGVEVADAGKPTDIDLLVSDGSTVHCFEVKQTGSSLEDAQLRGLLEVAQRLKARPGIAALDGEFDAALAEKVRGAGGRVLTGTDLVP